MQRAKILPSIPQPKFITRAPVARQTQLSHGPPGWTRGPQEGRAGNPSHLHYGQQTTVNTLKLVDILYPATKICPHGINMHILDKVIYLRVIKPLNSLQETTTHKHISYPPANRELKLIQGRWESFQDNGALYSCWKMRQPKPHHRHQPKSTKSKHMKCLPTKPHSLHYSAKRTSGKSRGFDLWLEHRWNYPAAHYLKMQSAGLQLICHSEKALRFYDENSFMRCSQNISPLTFPIYLTFAALPWQTFMCNFKAM